MRRQIIHDHHIPFLQGRGQLRLDIEVERVLVDRPIKHPRRVQSVMAQGSNEGLRVPMPEGRVVNQPLPARRPACAFDHIGLQPCLIDKGQALQFIRHVRLAVGDPKVPLARNIRPLLLNRLQVFFYA